jgi:hypothetical protein
MLASATRFSEASTLESVLTSNTYAMKRFTHILITLMTVSLLGCSDILDKQPLDKMQGEQLFSDPQGVRLYMANLYSQLPVEDFTFFRNGFNINSGDPNNGGFTVNMLTDEAVHSEFGDFMRDEDLAWWDPAYKLIRDVNQLIDVVPQIEVPESERNQILGEALFIRGYAYFGLVKRYGGVPLIDKAQAYTGDIESLKVPRSTEKATWDFLLSDLKEASLTLPSAWASGERRATKWAALALMSRAGLHAASVAKFSTKLPLSGIAADAGLVGLSANDANGYYQTAITAAEEVIKSGVFGLYQPTPANPQEAASNIRAMFENPNVASSESIFIKGYAIPGSNRGHNYDIWFQPAQLANGWPHPGRMNPTLEFVEQYETYDNPGKITQFQTRVDGNESDYNGFNANVAYNRFEDTQTLFANRDARFHATVVAPNSMWKDRTIIIQAGFVKPDGSPVIRTKDQIEVNGVTYHSYGAENPSQYSGFDTYGGNNTRTGFSFKKFLDEDKPVVPGWNQSVSDFADIRYAEVLLNYAEAVLESGLGDLSIAHKALNDIRRRAAHTVEVPLTIENVLRERRVELAFENKRYWDLIRRREYEDEFTNRRRHSLFPILDLRENKPSYIFVRAHVPATEALNFLPRYYYRPIPGIGGNGLVQNPSY